MEHVISDECLRSIMRKCHEAGASGRDCYTARAPDGPEIVRCRDCESAFETELEPSLLNCTYFSQWDYYNDEPGYWLVQPDGFCSWGQKAERCMSDGKVPGLR